MGVVAVGTRAAGAAALAVLGRKDPATLPYIFNHLCAAGQTTFGIASPIVMLRRCGAFPDSFSFTLQTSSGMRQAEKENPSCRTASSSLS